MTEKIHKHRYHSAYQRALFSLLLVAFILSVGTVGLHRIEGLSYVDAFYFMSMIATGEGPTNHPLSDVGKIFVSFMAFISVGAAVAALGFLFGPFLGQLWRLGVTHLEEEIEHLHKEEKK